MKSQDLPKAQLPDTPGVYFFVRPKGRGEEILYIGKATSLRDRVRSYFATDIAQTRGPKIVQMLALAQAVKYEKTDSVLEALLLEAELIKKHQPPYNTDGKDDKSYTYVVITKEDFPRVLLVRGRDVFSSPQLSTKNYQLKTIFGPFPHAGELKEALRIIRKIFPYRDRCLPAESKLLGRSSLSAVQGAPENRNEAYGSLRRVRIAGRNAEMRQTRAPNPCFNRQIGLCPGVCTGEISKKDYGKIIAHLKLFFQGRKTRLIKQLEREMKEYAKTQEFEKAAAIKKTMFALNHIQDVALIRNSSHEKAGKTGTFRIEGYDIAHISGAAHVGVMVVVEDGEAKKSDYRKFKIKTVEGANDTASLKEVLERRLAHASPEYTGRDRWPLPQLIVVDGSTAQVNTAKRVLKEQFEDLADGVAIVGVVKNERHRPERIIGDAALIRRYERAILLANNEAHRFAIGYHRDVRRKGLTKV